MRQFSARPLAFWGCNTCICRLHQTLNFYISVVLKIKIHYFILFLGDPYWFNFYQIKSQVTPVLWSEEVLFSCLDVSWWLSAPTLQILLKWINTLKMHLFSFRNNPEQEGSQKFCHIYNDFWSLWWSDGTPNDHSFVFCPHDCRVWVRITMAKPLIETEIPK